MTALFVAAAVHLAVLAVRQRRIAVGRFLEPPSQPSAARRPPVRIPAALMFGCSAGILVAAAAAPPNAPFLAAVGAGGGLLTGRLVAASSARARVKRIDHELPLVADMLSLHVLAGDSVARAIERLVASESSSVAADVRAALDEVPGSSLDEALRTASTRSSSPRATRLYDVLAHAHRTGGRLAENLDALADDLRSGLEADLTAEGGRRSLAVYGPVLALMVPVTLVFLMYPTLAGLRALSGP